MTTAEDVLILNNAAIVDGASAEPVEDMHILVREGRIDEVSDKPLTSGNARVLDLAGKTLMPGLIDCHTHVIATTVALGDNALLPDSLVTVRALKIVHGMLMRGFTTVRDLGGAD